MKRKPWTCDICGAFEQHGHPLHELWDGSLMACASCFQKELEHRKLTLLGGDGSYEK
jgi:hypothetical protein